MKKKSLYILSQLQKERGIKIVKDFTGGSGAYTSLIYNNDKLCVRKEANKEKVLKLKAQYQWLKEHRHLAYLPKTLEDGTTANGYYYDMEYYSGYDSFFDFIHLNDPNFNKVVLKNIVRFCAENIYKKSSIAFSMNHLNYYINIKLRKKIAALKNENEDINYILKFQKIIINGVECENYPWILEKIANSKNIMDTLSRISNSDIHGDLTIENILVNNEGDFLLIDPNNENLISEPLVDIAKIFQSLHSGYEFLCLLKDCSIERDRVNFEEKMSDKYSLLYHDLLDIIRDYFRLEDTQKIIFHEAMHYARLLPYRNAIDTRMTTVFYCIMVRLLNEYYYKVKN